MKTKLFFYLFALCGIFAVASCGNDDFTPSKEDPEYSENQLENSQTINVVQTEDGDLKGGGLLYKITSYTTKTVEAYKTSDEVDKNSFNGGFIVPAFIEYNDKKYTVTSIGTGLFKKYSKMSEVSLPKTLVNIGDESFRNCSALISVTIPNLVTDIGDAAFEDCSHLISVTIGNSVTSIGSHAFNRCQNLASVTFNATNCTKMGTSSSTVFSGCVSFKEVKFGNNVQNIPQYAFYKCSNLVSVAIPSSVTSIGDGAFTGCSSLPILNNIRYADTYLIEVIDKTHDTYSIKAGTRWIGASAFSGCSNLISIDIPNSVTAIENSAFLGCYSLESFAGKFASEDQRCLIVDGVLNSFAPAGQTSYKIPNLVTTIGDGAFSGCRNLKLMEIPNTVTMICKDAFYQCI